MYNKMVFCVHCIITHINHTSSATTGSRPPTEHSISSALQPCQLAQVSTSAPAPPTNVTSSPADAPSTPLRSTVVYSSDTARIRA